MSEEHDRPQKTSLQQLGILFKSKNILRTVASVVPGAGALLEIQSQLDGAALDDRVTSLEEVDLSVQAKVAQLESSQPKPPVQDSNWPAAAADYLRRVVDFAVVYDGKVDPTPRPGREVFLTVAHGCFVGPKTVLTCVEAINTASDVANYKRGRVAIIAGFSWYEFELETTDKWSGIVTCKITQRDERRYSLTKARMKKAGLPDTMFPEPWKPRLRLAFILGLDKTLASFTPARARTFFATEYQSSNSTKRLFLILENLVKVR